MDADAIRQLQSELDRYLERFSHCSCDSSRSHTTAYVEGQLSELERRNVEKIAINAGVGPRTLQEFLASYAWDHEAMRDQLQRIVATEQSGPTTIGSIEETSLLKKGTKTPGVERKHCGAVGKHDDCTVTVHLGYACEGFHCLLDGDLFLPESWLNDRSRCKEAQIPGDMVYRPKTEIALELYDRSIANGLTFTWLTFAEWCGAKPAFLNALDQRGQMFVGEIHRNHVVWMQRPRATDGTPSDSRRGRSRKTPRIVSGSPKEQHVGEWFETAPESVGQKWQRWHVKDTEKGPKVVEVKRATVYPKNPEGLPSKAHHVVVVRDVLTNETRFFLSNAPGNTGVGTLLKIAFSQWRVERCFEDDKNDLGPDQLEGPRYTGLLRHLILSAVSLLFLARSRRNFLASYPELTISQVHQATTAAVQSRWLTPLDAEPLIEHTAYRLKYYQKRNAQARKSHTRTRVKKLASLGIDLDNINKCDSNTG